MARGLELDWVVIRVQPLRKILAVVVVGLVAAGLVFFAYKSLNLSPEARARRAIERGDAALAHAETQPLPAHWQDELEQAKENLLQTEDSLQSFLERNRLYESSPALVFRRTRLDRQVSISAGIVSRLQEQLEQAQLDQLRETPTMSVIDQPDLPQRRVVISRETEVFIRIDDVNQVMG